LLSAVGGCGACPFEVVCAVFVLEVEEEVGWLVGAPTAGEARELGFALETVAATLGPPTAVPLVDVNGMVRLMAGAQRLSDAWYGTRVDQSRG
jgi:hypothetical protein